MLKFLFVNKLLKMNEHFEIAIGPLGYSSDPTFWFFKAPSKKYEYQKITSNYDCECSMDRSRSPELQGTLFSEIG